MVQATEHCDNVSPPTCVFALFLHSFSHLINTRTICTGTLFVQCNRIESKKSRNPKNILVFHHHGRVFFLTVSNCQTSSITALLRPLLLNFITAVAVLCILEYSWDYTSVAFPISFQVRHIGNTDVHTAAH